MDISDLRKEPGEESKDLVYSLNDRPPWYLCILLGFQVHHNPQALVVIHTPDGVTHLVTGAVPQISTFQGSLAKRKAQGPKVRGSIKGQTHKCGAAAAQKGSQRTKLISDISSAAPPLVSGSKHHKKKKNKTLLNLLLPPFKLDSRMRPVPYLTFEHVWVLLPAIFGLDCVVTSGYMSKSSELCEVIDLQ